MIQAPRQAWLLAVSALFLALALGLHLLPLSRWLVTVAALTVAMALVTVAILWPTLVPWLLYGSQPGLVVLLFILLGQWMLRERYRRQMVFLPGFSRIKPGSSLSRGGSSVKTREPSTVDAPAQAAAAKPGAAVPSTGVAAPEATSQGT